MPAEAVRLRDAVASDAAAIAALHADSWRRNYRGAYSDTFLDGDMIEDRRRVWTQRLDGPDPRAHTVVADAGGDVIGFVHVVLDDDARWGALLDNLHVAPTHQRRGLGARLMSVAARPVVERGTGLYLWVQEQNVAAQAFYRALGADVGHRTAITPPGGVAERLVGTPWKLRCTWSDPGLLVIGDGGDGLGRT